MAVYAIRFKHPLGDPDKPRAAARYYIGWTCDSLLVQRLLVHWHGISRDCPKIIRHLRARGIEFELVAVWWGADRTFEKRLKKNGHYARRIAAYHQHHAGDCPAFVFEPAAADQIAGAFLQTLLANGQVVLPGDLTEEDGLREDVHAARFAELCQHHPDLCPWSTSLLHTRNGSAAERPPSRGRHGRSPSRSGEQQPTAGYLEPLPF